MGENFGQYRYHIEYYGNGATLGSMEGTSHVFDTEFWLAENQFVKNSTVTFVYGNGQSSTSQTLVFDFVGWKGSSDSETILYAEMETVFGISDIPGATVHLYAEWASDGIELDSPSREGYTFLGWTTNSEAKIAEYQGGNTYVFEENVILYAVWKANNAVTIKKQPSGGTITYGETFTFTTQATGMEADEPPYTITYQWQESVSADGPWNNIAGATSTSLTIPSGKNAGTYWYKVVATSTIKEYDGIYGDYQVQTTSDAAKLVIKKAADTITLKDQYGNKIKTGAQLVYALRSGTNVVGTVTTVSGTEATVKSNDSYIVSSITSGTQILSLNPQAENYNGTEIVISTEESTNYLAASLTYKAYICDGPIIVFAPDINTITNQDVVVTVTVTDPVTHADGNHKVTSVDSGAEFELIQIGNGTYQFTAKKNGTYTVYTEDSLGSTQFAEYEIDWIDKEAPSMNISASYDPADGLFNTYLIAYDNMSSNSELMYCWNYNESNPSSNVWAQTNTDKVLPGTMVKAAVRDTAGNITCVEYLVVTNGSSGDGGADSSKSILASVKNDMTGKIFGRNSYLNSANPDEVAVEYVNGKYVVTFTIKPNNDTQYVDAYIEFAGQKFRPQWYTDEGLGTSHGYLSDDGSAVLAKGEAVGRIELDPALFASRTIRSANAELYIIRYKDTAMSYRIGAEKYSMPCSVDVTAPTVSASYNEYSRVITVVGRDAMTALKDGVRVEIDGYSETVDSGAEIIHPTDAAITSSFVVKLTCEDKLGNVAVKNYTFTSYSSESWSGGGHWNDDVNVYEYITRHFFVSVVNGSMDNSNNP